MYVCLYIHIHVCFIAASLSSSGEVCASLRSARGFVPRRARFAGHSAMLPTDAMDNGWDNCLLSDLHLLCHLSHLRLRNLFLQRRHGKKKSEFTITRPRQARRTSVPARGRGRKQWLYCQQTHNTWFVQAPIGDGLLGSWLHVETLTGVVKQLVWQSLHAWQASWLLGTHPYDQKWQSRG